MTTSSNASALPLEDPDLHRTIVLLANHHRAIRSRSFGLADLDRQRDDLLAHDGSYKDAPSEDRNYLEAVMYLQLFDRVHLMIADFGALCNALLGQLTAFPIAMAAAPSAKSILRRLNRDSWYNLLRYGELEKLGVAGDDRDFVEMVRNRNLDDRMQFAKRLQTFISLYQQLHAKHKHGNLLLYGLDELSIGGERVLAIPVVYDTTNASNLGYVIVTERIYRIWQQLHNDLVVRSLDLVRRSLLYIERGRVGIVEHSTMFATSDVDSERLAKIVVDADALVPTYRPVRDAQYLDIPYETIRQHISILSSLYEDQ